MTAMRAKLVISKVEQTTHSDTLHFGAVCAKSYPADGSDEDNTYAKFTPSAEMKISITNPALIGQFKAGEAYYVDFTKVVPAA